MFQELRKKLLCKKKLIKLWASEYVREKSVDNYNRTCISFLTENYFTINYRFKILYRTENKVPEKHKRSF